MKIAIIGSGISGMVAARYLCRDHHITVFEASHYVGGHTHTVDVKSNGQRYSIDTGFIVFNLRNYPNFVRLLTELGVAHQPSKMSFSVTCERTALEYNGTTVNSLFAQRRNLLRPSFYRMIVDILRFNHEAPKLLTQDDTHITLGDYLRKHNYSDKFIEHYIIPMGAAIWSARPTQMQHFPARHFVAFFNNHGMLSINKRPQWLVIKGGSRKYVEKLTMPYRHRIRLNTPVTRLRRHPNYVALKLANGKVKRFDQVFVACHSDQALSLLADATPAEREVLGAIPYQENEAVLHTDINLLPTHRLAWAGWNYHIPRRDHGRVAVTYNMNILQNIDAQQQFCVTLNHSDAIDPKRIIKRIIYHHPVYSAAGVRAQKRHAEINGVKRTYYCGAYWGFGFHEDGVNSALAACEHLGERISDGKLHLRRAS